MPFRALTFQKNKKKRKNKKRKKHSQSFKTFLWTILYRILCKSDVKCAPFSKASLSVKRFLQNWQVFDILCLISPKSVQKYAADEQKFIYALT